MKTAQHTNCLNRYSLDSIPMCIYFILLNSAFIIGCTVFSVLLYLIVRSYSAYDPYEAVIDLCNHIKGTFLIITPVITLITWIVVFFLQLKTRKAATRRATVDMNRILLQFKVLSGVHFSSVVHCSSLRTKVTFFYFDAQQCETHLKDTLYELDKTICSEEYSKALIVNLSEEYTRDYLEGKLKYQVGFVTRHVRHVKCLCQYIEDLLSQQENIKEFCEKKVKLAPREIV